MTESHVKFHSANGRRLVLVVDDEEINRAILGGILETAYEVIFAVNGEEALNMLREHREMLSLVLLDLILPDMHGFDILREMRADPQFSHLPVIVLTSDRASEVESLTIGAADFIPKPYPEPKVILARALRTIELSEDRDIIQMTERDHLTGLYNREYFYRYAEQFDQHHRDMPMDAIVLDVNHFHMINERYGKAYGDEVLKRIGERVRDMVRDSGGIVCRRESDTFLVYCPHRTDYASILESASAGLAGEGNADSRIRLRMGVYSEVDKSIDIERRFDRAKNASDTVRNSYSKAIAIYDQTLHDSEIFAEQLLEDFHEAIEQHQFQVYFQPKFDIRPDQPALASAEALVRWQHPRRGMISPGIFIPLFEENGLIQVLDSYVWRETAAHLRDWKDRLGTCVPVSVNASRIDMYDPNMVENLRGLMEEYGLDPQDMLLEITESAYTQDSEQIIDTVHQLRNLGFRIEMDDFGSGYSSLNMISTLPIDVLKLDMLFIRNAFVKKNDTRILEVIIEIAEYLSVPVVAEGVETQEQMEALRDMGCAIVQGYYFSKPVPAQEFEGFLLAKKQSIDGAPAEAEEPAPAKMPASEPETEQPKPEPMPPFVALTSTAQLTSRRGVSLRMVSFIFVVVAFLIAVGLYAADGLVTRGYQNMKTASQNYIQAEQAANRLERGSDYLTEKARCFVVTGGLQDMRDYLEEIEVTKSRDAAVASLEELLEGSDSEAYGYLSEALELSNKLSGLEYRAMRLTVAGGVYGPEEVPEAIRALDLSPEERSLTVEEKRRAAEELVFGREYADYKARIRSSTALCTQALIKSSDQELKAVSEGMGRLLALRTALMIAFFAVVLAFVIFVSTCVRKPLSRMVALMKAKTTVPPAGAEELRFVTRTYNEIFEENQKTNERLTFEAMHDALTGLYNRNAYELLHRDIDLPHAALLFMDVDKFKEINDTYGHDVGDKVLKRVAEVLQHSFRSVDQIFRTGGDEFVVVMTRANSTMRELVLAKVEQANVMLQNPKDGVPPTSLSVGVAFGDRKNPQGDILKDADTALYRVKERGRGGCVIY